MINKANRFDGCRRACRSAQKHTKTPGECAAAPPPVKTISISRITTADDGHPAIVLKRYSEDDLAALIEPKLTYLLKHHGDRISGAALAQHVASTLIDHNPDEEQADTPH